MSQTNFRAQDMPGRRGGADGPKAPKPAPQPESKPAPAPAPAESNEGGDSPAVEAPEQVPDAATPAVLAWVGDDKNRAQQALDKEQQSENPRKGLTNELNEIIEK